MGIGGETRVRNAKINVYRKRVEQEAVADVGWNPARCPKIKEKWNE